MTNQRLRLAITPGAENGVGPELLIAALLKQNHKDPLNFLWCGDARSMKLAAQRAGITVTFFDTGYARLANGCVIRFFEDIKQTSILERQADFLRKSVELIKNRHADAIVTGPVDKACLKFLDSGDHHGQTEYLTRHLALNHHEPFMAFMGGPFLLSLLTTHLPLRSVADAISFDKVLAHLQTVADHGGKILNKSPKELRILVLGLNPHAGEAGLLGREDLDILAPAIKAACDLGLNVDGPSPADGFFAYFHQLTAEVMPDIVVAIYHDQGLIPYKLLAKGSAVNVTLGLTVPRTSPAHGTAYDRAGKGLACPKSTESALQAAIYLASF